MDTAQGSTSNRVTPSPLAPGFDLCRVRCVAESELRALIEKDSDFFTRLMSCATERQQALVDGRLSLIKDTYRVDALITPALDDLRERIRSTLRLVQPIDMYIQSSPEPNAFCIPSRKGTRLVMCLHSALLDLLTSDELMFVMGHEIGHALLEHARIPKIGFDDAQFSPLEVVRTRALGRRQEVSCDRIGLLACQNIDVAGSALLKIMSGLSERWLTFDAAAFAKHFDQIADMAEVTSMDDATSTHPVIGLRVKALLTFFDSELYAEATNSSGGRAATAEMEKATQHLLGVLEPDLSEIESASEKDAANALLVSGAMALVAADGALDRAEMTYLREHVNVSDDMVEAMSRPDFVSRTIDDLGKPAWILSRKLSVASRAGVLHELCRVALSAGGYADNELKVLSQLGQMLQIPESLFSNVLRETEPPKPNPEAGPAVAKPARRKRKTKATASEEPERRRDDAG